MNNPLRFYQQALANPWSRWLVILGTLAYLILPFDISPDFIPLLGQIDDVVLVWLLVTAIAQIWQVAKQSADPTSSTNQTTVDDGEETIKTIDVDATAID